MKTILVIDDEEDIRHLIAHLLKPTGYRVIHAENGIEGIRKALSFHPDVMTVDVLMPRLNGLHMMRILSLMKLQIPSIFVTVKADIHQYSSQFPSVSDVCLKDQLQDELLPKVQAILNSERRRFTDISYTLQEKEAFGLLGKSDRKKILIVSSVLTYELIMAMLSESDLYEIYQAPNGQEAVFKAVMIRPDLILCDVDVQNIDGITLARMLYILGHPFPITFLSDKSDAGLVKKASKLEGIKGFFLKSEIMRDRKMLEQRIESILNISDEDKKRLKASYETINIDKIEDFGEDSSIWASLSP